MECAGKRPVRAAVKPGGGGFDLPVLDDHAILVDKAALDGDEAVQHVARGPSAAGRSYGMAVTAPTAGFEPQDVAADEHIAVGDRGPAHARPGCPGSRRRGRSHRSYRPRRPRAGAPPRRSASPGRRGRPCTSYSRTSPQPPRCRPAPPLSRLHAVAEAGEPGSRVPGIPPGNFPAPRSRPCRSHPHPARRHSRRPRRPTSGRVYRRTCRAASG